MENPCTERSKQNYLILGFVILAAVKEWFCGTIEWEKRFSNRRS